MRRQEAGEERIAQLPIRTEPTASLLADMRGDDEIAGGSGADTLWDGRGHDTLHGGPGTTEEL